MSTKSKRSTTTIALLLAFAIGQIYVGVSFAGPKPITVRSEVATAVPQQPATGILTTQSNKPITLNGATAISGATIMSGAAIETPDGIGATVSLGSLGSLDISPKTKLTLEFQNGSVKVMVTEGCVTLHTKKGTTGEVDTPNGVAGKSEANKDGVIRMCPDRTPALAAGAGGLFGLGTAATVGVIAGGVTAVIVPVILTGRNPSPTNP